MGKPAEVLHDHEGRFTESAVSSRSGWRRGARCYRHLAAVESVERKRLPVRCFDDGLATEEQIAGLPVAGDPMVLLYGKREPAPVIGSRPAIVLSRRFAAESVP